MTLIVSLHHVALAQRYCERVLALRDGALVFDGPSAALTPAFLRELYGTAVEELLGDDHPAAPTPRLQLAAAA
jgi:phosphonate transport system ATP-binding protein